MNNQKKIINNNTPKYRCRFHINNSIPISILIFNHLFGAKNNRSFYNNSNNNKCNLTNNRVCTLHNFNNLNMNPNNKLCKNKNLFIN